MVSARELDLGHDLPDQVGQALASALRGSQVTDAWALAMREVLHAGKVDNAEIRVARDPMRPRDRVVCLMVHIRVDDASAGELTELFKAMPAEWKSAAGRVL